VNNIAVQIPYHTSSYSIFYSGVRVRYETTFGLAVEFDGYWFLAVDVPSIYFGKMGGMCGNNDDEPSNDLTLPDGTDVGSLANGEKEFGDSCVVDDPEQADQT
jgi:hypothetical protein